MDQLLVSTTIAIAALAAFLIFITALKYAMADTFMRTRLIMTAFVLFIVIAITASFWRYTIPSLGFSVPALVLGMLVGHLIGVRAAQEKLVAQGVERYIEHITHVNLGDPQNLEWWSVINFYTIAGALVIINLLGLSVVLFNQSLMLALTTCAIGAFLVGTLVPYLVHLWSLGTNQSTPAA
jgi:hypothetical protein